MHLSFFIELLQNIAILLAFSMIYGNFRLKNEDSKSLTAKFLIGSGKLKPIIQLVKADPV